MLRYAGIRVGRQIHGPAQEYLYDLQYYRHRQVDHNLCWRNPIGRWSVSAGPEVKKQRSCCLGKELSSSSATGLGDTYTLLNVTARQAL